MSAKVKVTIDVTSDLACPWCYVGWKRFQNAVNQFLDELDVDVHWHPYMIDMKTKKDGEGYMEYNKRRWGSDGWVYGMKESALPDGAKFANWGRNNLNSVWANTFNAHKFLYIIKTKCSWKKMHEMKVKLFDEYYEKGVNISLVDELIRIGNEENLQDKDESSADWGGGVRKLELEELMRSETYGFDEVLKEDKAAKKKGISGVPFFEILGHTVNGAQSTKYWLSIFQQIAKK